jgi:hypothetical protein
MSHTNWLQGHIDGSWFNVVALMASELIPGVVGIAFLASMAIVMVVMRMEKLTPAQFFWLAAILLGAFFFISMLFYMKYT